MFVNSDFSDLLRLFNAGRVRYLVIGGYAVIQYAEPRFTADLDLWTDTGTRNGGAIYKALLHPPPRQWGPLLLQPAGAAGRDRAAR